MNLYHIRRTDKWGYDDYDSAVVAAPNPEVAKIIPMSKWSGVLTAPEFIEVNYLGKADPSIKLGVVCASFNAG